MGTLIDARNPSNRLPLSRKCVTLGRSQGCEITVANHHVSRVHARLSWTWNGWHLEDVKSRNGVWLLQEGGGRSRVCGMELLEAGDQFSLGLRGPAFRLFDPQRPLATATNIRTGHLLQEEAAGVGLIIPGVSERVQVICEGHTWRLMRGEHPSSIPDDGTITVDGEQWLLDLPGFQGLENTLTPPESAIGVDGGQQMQLHLRKLGQQVHLQVIGEGGFADLGMKERYRLLWSLAKRPGEWFSHQEILEDHGLELGSSHWVYTTCGRCRGDLHERTWLKRAEVGRVLETSRSLGVRLGLHPTQVVVKEI